jgi:predicted permease
VDLPRAEGVGGTIAARIAREYPGDNGGSGAALFQARAPRMSPEALGTVRAFAGVLMTGVSFLLLAACVNVAHMQLARNLARGREMAVRAALGAGRARLAYQLFTESALLSLPGLALSLPVTLATQHLLTRFSLPFAIPLDYELHFDGRVFLFAALLTASTVAGFGLLPALRAARADLRAAFQPRGSGPAQPHRRLAGALVGLQVALSLVLLVGAGLFARSLRNAAHVDLGFRVDDVVVMNVDFNADRHRFDEARASRYYREALERVRALPGVKAASWAGDVPLGVRKIVIGFFPEPRDAVAEHEWETFFCDVVSDGYFATMGIPVRGREFTPRDGPDAVEVAVVNGAAAHRHWPDGDPIGRRFKVRGRTGIRTVEIVGVAGDVRQRSFRETPEPRLYFALAQRHFPEMALHARVTGEPVGSIPAIRAALAAVEPDLPVFTARPMREQVAAALSQPRMAAALLGAAAATTLALACLGVYGVSVRAAVERRREVGIRVALGARPADVRRLVLAQALAPIGAGSAAGILSAAALGRGLESFLLEVRATDGATFLASGLVLAVVAGTSIYIPSRRLASLDPAAVLREE